MSKKAKGEALSSQGTVLVLGFPSEVSTAVTQLLLESGHIVYGIVSQEEFSCTTPLKKRFGKQLQLHVGNGNHLDFGLSGVDYLQLADRVDYVLALFTKDSTASTASTASTNPGGKHTNGFFDALAKELVEFSKVAVNLKRVVYLSDFSFVAGFNGVVAESDLQLPMAKGVQEELPSFRIERVLHRFQDTFPVSIVRCGTIVGQAEGLCPMVMLALAHPELFVKSRAFLLLVDIGRLTQFLAECLFFPNFDSTVHLFNELETVKALGSRLAEQAQGQVPRTFDIRTAARRKIIEMGYDPRAFSRLQTVAKVENTWTNQLLKAHNFPHWNQSLNWSPLVESAVESLIGFR